MPGVPSALGGMELGLVRKKCFHGQLLPLEVVVKLVLEMLSQILFILILDGTMKKGIDFGL